MAAVDDLQITFAVTSGASLFDASNWAVDLAGLAVSADLAGVTLAGGLRKFGTEPNIEYVGMLMARVATYGLSIYGGYGTGVSDGTRFTAFFAFGAVTGPIGGPPAFFVTGIGGGFGINRDLVFPSSLSTFGDFVMISALDASASAPSDPMQALVAVRDTFPMRRDRFWFAAGLGFTSFALVDGVAVVAVSFGGGFELTILGLGRMALPRPQVALVSIEIGLIARFSTRDGVMWVQAELTENSWLLHESVRLTGGFAYVMWFGGPHAGEFVLTLGGFHPDFHRDGYPQVPRLGFRWQVSDFISIKGENYFALTSEALMAGGALEASASAWAGMGQRLLRRQRHHLLRSVPLRGGGACAHRGRRHHRPLARRDHHLRQHQREDRGQRPRVPRHRALRCRPGRAEGRVRQQQPDAPTSRSRGTPSSPSISKPRAPASRAC